MLSHVIRDRVMTLHEDALAVMRSGRPRQEMSESLLELVRHVKSEGVNQRIVYETLRAVAEELGCNDDRYDSKSELCDAIGSVMDRVWGWCPKGQEIWDTSLSAEQGET